MELEWWKTPKNEWLNEDSIFCWDRWRTHLIMHLRKSWFLLHFCRKDLPSEHSVYVTFCFLNYVCNELLCIYLEVKHTFLLHHHVFPQSQYFFIFMSAGNFHDVFLKHTNLLKGMSRLSDCTCVNIMVKSNSSYALSALSWIIT